MFDLSETSSIILKNLDSNGWKAVVEDDNPDFKQLVCRKSPGPIETITRLDVLVMTPELNPANASGACLCFIFYANPGKVSDMRKLGKLIRQDNFMVLRKESEFILHNIIPKPETPSVTCKTRPRFERIRFDNNTPEYPAFLVELDYWIPANSSKGEQESSQQYEFMC